MVDAAVMSLAAAHELAEAAIARLNVDGEPPADIIARIKAVN